MKVTNKTILVTGANRGIGKTILESLLTPGATKVYAAVRDVSTVLPLVEAYGDKVVPLAIDLSQPETITAAAQTAHDVDIVINNAGVLKTAGALDAHAIESLEFEFDVNVFGFLRVAQAFAPVLKANGGGALVQLNSVVSIKNFANFATYSASKAASYSLTQALRDSLSEQGTHVLSVHPGPIATDMGDAAGLTEIAEPPSVVSAALIEGLENETFHVFPDTMAKQFEGAYKGFAEAIVEPQMAEA